MVNRESIAIISLVVFLELLESWLVGWLVGLQNGDSIL